MQPTNHTANRITRFVLPFIIPNKTLLSRKYGFINAYTKTILKTTIVLVFNYDLNHHDVIHEVLGSLKHFKGHYQNQTYEMLEFDIPNDVADVVSFILEGGVYGLPSAEKLKIVAFWEDFSLSYMIDLLKDLNEVDVLEVDNIKDEVYNYELYSNMFNDDIDEVDDLIKIC